MNIGKVSQVAAQLVVMGSGETAPTMVKVHREVLTGTTPRAVALDSPYGFQVNAEELSARAAGYFRDSVGLDVEVLRWRHEPRRPAEEAAALATVRNAGWVFAGPGSPTYALQCWRGTAMASTMVEVCRRGGTLLLASAAALATGSHVVPVYEIYKCGAEPAWVPGLDALGQLTGVHAAVIPHWDNAEGGSYDTRFCYLGEQRLAALEEQLPEGHVVLGVDEHTALVVDLDAGVARVLGNRTVTVRRGQRARVLPAGSVVPLAALADPGSRTGRSGAGPASQPTRRRSGRGGAADPTEGARLTHSGPGSGPGSGPASGPGSGPASGPGSAASAAEPVDLAGASSLREAADLLEAAFTAALAARSVEDCVHVALELEQAITAWSADTLQSDDAEHARHVLRGMLTQLGELARTGARDPREVLGGFVELLLDLRERARNARDWATADTVRDRLRGLGVQVRDTPDGHEWELVPGTS